MANVNLFDFEATNKEYKNKYSSCKNHYKFDFSNLDLVFQIAINKPKLELFPTYNLPANNSNIDSYLTRWIDSYVNSIKNLPSMRLASKKQTPSDPGLKEMVQTLLSLSNSKADEAEKYHNLFMSAENVQGNLLEEYINTKAKNFGWIWCAGNILRAIDFCKIQSDGTTVLLQIKSKFNTENSSSSKVRKGTAIEKWHRLGKKSFQGEVSPVFNWQDLNKIMAIDKKSQFSEEDYQRFLRKVVSNNPAIIKS
ncbi:SinI family restriction endonuclease [Domibacillus indicus]|uniref:SinI family restriction endonuclease n=1 Tax=Domibacillus indicus TaxID=1437523 RepID=UPI000697FBAD|nr:SinI family restriction endonuclease [Domibacillus indicus]